MTNGPGKASHAANVTDLKSENVRRGVTERRGKMFVIEMLRIRI